ncbi:ABC-F family ATP-binding cassette domain-containing protein [Rhodococcus sp. BP-252]|uniref:ABC transporter n=1 Tax=Rhodococcoides kyotonense TaxID=398843 RepID=A0A177YC16_9NOCA|nr:MULTISPECIES: ATP-binding cassette domain-containing protein [Rhodococcus]MBY6412953.1 ABC-F family ATP-binding cassette domain-containing protein [Rhodococcus sp. BP-320]MBY6419445.1 ABC-F family ATP-binding cassette domain-containing protein [Rhodococcus sp. BP-321]MBY6423853.1 ABC-F family ATP-binding cassette domain-containing protein [Rhodococcus sp. BP-324]MBY6429137.1 ABC-F family ATP-binding cassette domain-containing protein [Rhodococcus sp. BP-323]MBY6432875.1 ABC-F family ATP-bin
MSTSSSLRISDLGFTWPDGSRVFDGLDAVFPTGRTGLVGSNGAGKSTLMKLVAGELHPQRGSITVPGELGYLPQDITLRAGRRVDDILRMRELRQALHRIEIGEFTDDDFAIVGSRWDAEERAVALLDKLGLGHIVARPEDLDRVVGTLSGGESMLLALTAELLAEPDVLLLDEPTNNLDRDARAHLYQAVQSFQGVLIVTSHDLDLLAIMDTTAEVRAERDGVSRLRVFGGNYEHYRDVVVAEQEAARAAVHDAKNDVRKQERELIEARTKLDRRARYGKKMNEQKREPKIVMGNRKRAAQVSAGKLRGNHLDKVSDAQAVLATAEDRLRDDREVRVELPATKVHAGQRIVSVASLEIVGPERIALIGPNGSGKTTLLRQLADAEPAVPWRYLPQRLDVFDESRSVAENVAAVAAHASNEQIRAQLARFLFRGSDADAVVDTLSGGERLRAALATILLAEPAPRFLMLDEPTNNLDLASKAHLTEALASYEGALVVASHDLPFLRDLEPTRWVELERA